MKLNNRTSIMLVYVSKLVNTFLSFIINYIITRKLVDASIFGQYSYILTLVSYIAIFFGFGFNDGLMNIVVNSNDTIVSRELCGFGYLLNIIFGFGFSLIIFVYSVFDKVVTLNLFIVFFSQAILMNDMLNRMSIAQKRTSLILLNNFSIYLFIVILYSIIDTTYINYLTIYFVVYFVFTNLLYFIGLKPIFKNISVNYRNLLPKVREFGFNVYLGRMASMSTYDLDKIMLKIFAPIEYVGFYNLGLGCTRPITMFSESILNILHKDMASQDRIEKKIIIVNMLWLLIVSVLFSTIGRWIFAIIFGPDYKYVTDCFIEFGILSFFLGLYLPYNIFLSVKGYGKYLRNTAFILTGANIVFNLLLIPRYHMKGAILATIIALIVDNIAHYYYYRRALNDIIIKKEEKIASLKLSTL